LLRIFIEFLVRKSLQTDTTINVIDIISTIYLGASLVAKEFKSNRF